MSAMQYQRGMALEEADVQDGRPLGVIMATHTRLLLAIAVVTTAAVPAAAQTATEDAPWTRATSLAVSGGAAHDEPDWNGSFGGAVQWELTPHLAIEGAGRWIDRGRESNAFAGELSALFGLAGTRDTFVPYVLAGVGFHHRVFDRRPAAADGMPAFYMHRFRADHGFGTRESFTDPTVVLGTGVDIALSRTVVVRPDARVLWAIAGGRRHPVAVVTVALGYRFEHKPVTPAR
jgi:hypothetical protein